MVARDPRGPDDLGALSVRRLFEAWRRLLGRGVTRWRAGSRLTAGRLPLGGGGSGTRGARGAADDKILVGVGIALLLGGAAARTLLAPDAARTAELLAGSMTVALAFVRLAIMALNLPRVTAVHQRLLWRPWAYGLIPFAAAVGPYTSMVAWSVSAGLTLTLLQREGSTESEARRAVILAWGAHAVIGAVAWLVRNAAVAALAA